MVRGGTRPSARLTADHPGSRKPTVHQWRRRHRPHPTRSFPRGNTKHTQSSIEDVDQRTAHPGHHRTGLEDCRLGADHRQPVSNRADSRPPFVHQSRPGTDRCAPRRPSARRRTLVDMHWNDTRAHRDPSRRPVQDPLALDADQTSRHPGGHSNDSGSPCRVRPSPRARQEHIDWLCLSGVDAKAVGAGAMWMSSLRRGFLPHQPSGADSLDHARGRSRSPRTATTAALSDP
jgi:hypothetical protein